MIINIVMCIYKRLYRIKNIVKDLNNQNCVKDIVLNIYNNSIFTKNDLMEKFKQFNPNFIINMTGNNGDKNDAGIGRFYIAKELESKFVIFLDDDNNLHSNNSIQEMLDEWKPKTIYSFWCGKFKPNKTYWEKNIGLNTHEECHYTGTGGMICDVSIFKDSNFFDKLPLEYYRIEDLWLSYYASHVLGWKLFKSKSNIGITHNKEDQNIEIKGLKQKKNLFLDYLRKNGWKV